MNKKGSYSLKILSKFLFASDLDGTLVPIGTCSSYKMERTHQMLMELRKASCPICYVTGRSLKMTKQLVRERGLISPDWWICDLGSEIYDQYEQPLLDWNKRTVLGPIRERIERVLQGVKGLTLQEMNGQGAGKCSYYSTFSDSEGIRRDVKKCLAGIRPKLRIVTSIDERTGHTLVDIVSNTACKSMAISFIASHVGFESERIHYSGDSGNDIDALLSGMRATLVGNASSYIRSEILKKVKTNSDANLYMSRACYVDGIIEGIKNHKFAYAENRRIFTCE